MINKFITLDWFEQDLLLKFDFSNSYLLHLPVAGGKTITQ